MSYEAEYNIVGCLLNGYGLSFCDNMDASDFEFLGTMFDLIKQNVQKGSAVDAFAIGKKAKMHVGDVAKMVSAALTSTFEGSVETLKKDSAVRKYGHIMAEPRVGEIYTVIDDTISELQGIRKYKTDKGRNMMDVCMDYISILDDREKNRGKEITTGMYKLDRTLGGLHKKEFTIIAARPGVGKTILGLQIACNAAKSHKVLFGGFEMADTQLYERMVARFGEVEHWKLKNADLKREDWLKVQTANEYITALDLKIDASFRKIDDVRTALLKERPELIVLDYLGLMSDTSKKFINRREEMMSVTRKLKTMALEFDIPIIALAQLGRAAQNKRPILSELRDSGSLEEDADNVILLHEMSEGEASDMGYVGINHEKRKPLLLMIEKQRNGQCLWIKAIHECGKFTIMEYEF